jgi:hypothetical protein
MATAVWNRRTLKAAYWVVHVLGPNGEPRDAARAHWPGLALGGEVDFADLHSALDGLLSCGLVIEKDNRLVPVPRLAALCEQGPADTDEALLAEVLDAERPPWLRLSALADGSLATELIPDETFGAIGSVFDSPERREAFLLARARKVEADRLAEIGRVGEEEVLRVAQEELVAAGRPDLAARCRHVSLISDELGYDVTAPTLGGRTRRLEVKAVGSTGDSAAIIMSRNEYETGAVDPDWALVIVRVRGEERLVLGWLRADRLVRLVPVDRCSLGNWQAARVTLAIGDLLPGLPPTE